MSLFVDEPFRATYDNGAEGEAPCLLVGVVSIREAIICKADGQLDVLAIDRVRLTWRYENGSWVDDAAPGNIDQTDQSGFGLAAEIGEDDGEAPDVPSDIRSGNQQPRRGRRS